ncbi:MAG: carboxymuconolactone decarboxylase family protein [Candidatus Stygibacter australis]|nr:carboxymuconolactone decarboxylase family protein [Candidatus Stygibacter australis]MDP8322327.1 carboxymuconolactone decarboxylase family protein [Candidatus Stygibacter australis]
MAFIKVISEEKADKKLAKLYKQLSGPQGKVANILKIHSLLPETLQAHLQMYRSIVFAKEVLSRSQREMIAVVVSAANKCGY